jgi:hypothetical protein
MTNSQEYALHVLNEIIVASVASAKNPRCSADADARASVSSLVERRLELADKLRKQVDAIQGRAADNNSILAAAFAAMSANARDPEELHHEDRLQQRIAMALEDVRLSPIVREGLAQASQTMLFNQGATI